MALMAAKSLATAPALLHPPVESYGVYVIAHLLPLVRMPPPDEAAGALEDAAGGATELDAAGVSVTLAARALS